MGTAELRSRSTADVAALSDESWLMRTATPVPEEGSAKAMEPPRPECPKTKGEESDGDKDDDEDDEEEEEEEAGKRAAADVAAG